MAIVPKALQISNPFPSTLNPNPNPNPKPSTIRRRSPPSLPPPRAADDDPSDPKDSTTQPTTTTASTDPDFESRLSQVRLKYRSGTGKKAELRRAKKAGGSTAKKKGSVMLPPVSLLDPIADGLRVEIGFTPYSERLHGRLAGLGLAALLLVELGSGQGLLKYHSSPIIFIQIYTVAAATALLVKYEKEKISVWPEKPPESTAGD
ncbi:Chlorophyll a-b binding protein [Dioscorea alata]|uniref:Chlorophyll a-b binding protein n=1 Tax=Dioscorea alata TaxID=55571 RepID=A0ACB7VUC4_DIOAL|nr:Chlorophyll a-b binding protein [Dioscorea alata]